MRAMRKTMILVIIGLFFGMNVIPIDILDQVQADSGDVVDSFNSPGFFPQGLTYDGNYLWNIDSDGKIYKLTKSGTVVDSFNSPDDFPMGLVWDGQYLWNSDWNSSYINGSFHGKIYKLTSSGTIVDSFYSPGQTPLGLAYDGQFLWNVNLDDDTIYKLTTSGDIISSFKAPGNHPFGLAWDGEYLWHSSERNHEIYKLTSSGTVIDSFNSPGDIPRGVTWDGEYLWHASQIDCKIYKIDAGYAEEPNIVIDKVSGGFRLTATISNSDTISVSDIQWSIDVELNGLGLLLSGEHTDGVIDELPAGESETIQTSGLTGIGQITITVQADEAVKQATGFLLGPLVLRVSEL